jgi:peptidoglycan LD-endopeptidase CwlK
MAARNNDPALLHPRLRAAMSALLSDLASERIPLRLFEGWRSPERQAALFGQGRVAGMGKPGKHVTRARAWGSFHQYGLAADLVFWVNDGYSWKEPAPGMWKRYHQLARKQRLEPLSFEMPHVQLEDIAIDDLRAGRYPPMGDDSWAANLDGAILAWGTTDRKVHGLAHPGAPAEVWARPEMDEALAASSDDDSAAGRPAGA